MAEIRGTKYTLDELYDNYEFKVVKRAIMREFPWITNVFVDPEELNQYNVIFLNFTIDLPLMLETYGWDSHPWVKRVVEKNEHYHTMNLGMFADVQYQEHKKVQDDILKLIQLVQESPALPQDLKIKGRQFTVGGFEINPGQPEWGTS